MSKIHASLACNLDSNLLLASLPLFQSEQVEAIEWSFDTLYQHRSIPPWFVQLLQAYGQEKRLVGHGVFLSIFSGKWSTKQAEWLNQLEKKAKHFHFNHISEHFGFMTGSDFHKGAPIGVPYSKTTLRLGQDRLKRIYNACNCPVGLENLAFSYSLEEVKHHGDFLNELLHPVNGFIILDLHNLFCQLHNFNCDFEDLIQLYPLERVREIHISGGSWSTVETTKKKIRRDTHDDSVPEEVFDLLKKTIPLCNHLKFVVLEQLGSALSTEKERAIFQEDFHRMKQIIQSFEKDNNHSTNNDFMPNKAFELSIIPEESEQLYEQQLVLSSILENAETVTEAKAQLAQSILANTTWQIETWRPEMIETAINIAQKWKNGY